MSYHDDPETCQPRPKEWVERDILIPVFGKYGWLSDPEGAIQPYPSGKGALGLIHAALTKARTMSGGDQATSLRHIKRLRDALQCLVDATDAALGEMANKVGYQNNHGYVDEDLSLAPRDFVYDRLDRVYVLIADGTLWSKEIVETLFTDEQVSQIAEGQQIRENGFHYAGTHDGERIDRT